MAEPVTAAELAEALRYLLRYVPVQSMSSCEDTVLIRLRNNAVPCRKILARYDAQQSEPSKPALSEVEQAAVKAVESYDAANSGKLRSAMIVLSEALRKRGAW